MLSEKQDQILSDKIIENLTEINKLPEDAFNSFFKDTLNILFEKECDNISKKEQELLDKCPKIYTTALLLMRYAQGLSSDAKIKLETHVNSSASMAKFCLKSNEKSNPIKPIPTKDSSYPTNNDKQALTFDEEKNPISQTPQRPKGKEKTSHNRNIYLRSLGELVKPKQMRDTKDFLGRVGLLDRFNSAEAELDVISKNVIKSVQNQFNKLSEYGNRQKPEQKVEHRFKTIAKEINTAINQNIGNYQQTNKIFVGGHKAIKLSRSRVDVSMYQPCSKKNSFSTILMNIELKANTNPPDDLEFGQVVHYTKFMWNSQIRRYILSGLIKRNELYFYSFTRSGDVRSLYTSIVIPDKADEVIEIKDSIKLLAFFMLLDEVELGLSFKGAASNPSEINILKSYPPPHNINPISADRIHKDISKYNIIEIVKKYSSPINPYGRAPWIFRVISNKLVKPGYLKVNGQPADRQLEIDVMRLLEKYEIPNVPKLKVYQRQDFGNNYAIEYMVLEDCGKPINEYFMQDNINITSRLIRKVIKDVGTCILSAASKGILHCDISTGNILINDEEEITVIDWGYSKVVEDSDLGEEQITNPDPITGTLPFMSIRVLLGYPNRTWIDDLESKFYVLVYCVAVKFNALKSVDKLLFWSTENTSDLANIRTKALNSSYQKLKNDVFINPDCIPNNIHRVLEQLYKILFTGLNVDDLKDCKVKVDPRVVTYKVIANQLHDLFGVQKKVVNSIESLIKLKTAINRVQACSLHHVKRMVSYIDSDEEEEAGEEYDDDNDSDSDYEDGCVDDGACSRGLRTSKRIINKKNNTKLKIRMGNLSLKPTKIPKISKFKH
ncbi:hypothetical protein H4219_002920 [Mycoemilia scoparia]|uniref:Protein kinase domain-containing protein n=1 Tax=Mycoemilia scoparia TaxID=417184 RepID=A0A9W7ZX15_9FUNG|nr:hypothetical protein H4219_002920 [Mycoemilia scoparia]